MRVTIDIPDDKLPEKGCVFIDDIFLNVVDRQVVESNYDFEDETAEPCTDCVSRQAVMKIVKRWYPYKSEIKELEALPSVTPTQRMGRWIEERTYMECTNCNDVWHYEANQTERFKFCPNCGAKMHELQESEVK